MGLSVGIIGSGCQLWLLVVTVNGRQWWSQMAVVIVNLDSCHWEWLSVMVTGGAHWWWLSVVVALGSCQ